jgi:hypothetical protein
MVERPHRSISLPAPGIREEPTAGRGTESATGASKPEPSDQEVRRMKVRSPAAPLVALVFLAAACANSSATSGGGGGSDDTIAYPTGASDLVLRISNEGGFVAPDYQLTTVAGFSLFGNGQVVIPGAQTMIYPGPALPPMVSTPLDAAGVQALLQDAIDAGLDHEAAYTDLGAVGIADASTTVFTLTTDGRTHVTKAYALGELGTKPDGMSQEEFAAREALLHFQGVTMDLRGNLPAGSVGVDGTFVPDELRLLVSGYQPDPQLKETPQNWPLDAPLADFGEAATMEGTRCGTVSGSDLEAVLPLAQDANQLTPWRSDGAKYAIAFRPLLPDESGC